MGLVSRMMIRTLLGTLIGGIEWRNTFSHAPIVAQQYSLIIGVIIWVCVGLAWVLASLRGWKRMRPRTTWTIKLGWRPWWPRRVYACAEMFHVKDMRAYACRRRKFFYYKVVHEYADGTRTTGYWANFNLARDFAYNNALHEDTIWCSGRIFRKYLGTVWVCLALNLVSFFV